MTAEPLWVERAGLLTKPVRLYNNCSTTRFLLEAAWLFEVSAL
jgi:hypothetical protein